MSAIVTFTIGEGRWLGSEDKPGKSISIGTFYKDSCTEEHRKFVEELSDYLGETTYDFIEGREEKIMLTTEIKEVTADE